MEKGSLQQKIISNMSEDKCYEKEKFRPPIGEVCALNTPLPLSRYYKKMK